MYNCFDMMFFVIVQQGEHHLFLLFLEICLEISQTTEIDYYPICVVSFSESHAQLNGELKIFNICLNV